MTLPPIDRSMTMKAEMSGPMRARKADPPTHVAYTSNLQTALALAGIGKLMNLQENPYAVLQLDPKVTKTWAEQDSVQQFLADMCQFNADIMDLQRFPSSTPAPYLPIQGEPLDDTLGDVVSSMASTAAELSDIIQTIQADIANGQGGTDTVEHLIREAQKKVDYLNQWIAFLQPFLNWMPPAPGC